MPCIKGEFNDKIDKTLPLEMKHLLAVFKAKEVEALKEDAFISSSAYSTMFSESVEAGEKEMNVQLGIRSIPCTCANRFQNGTCLFLNFPYGNCLNRFGRFK